MADILWKIISFLMLDLPLRYILLWYTTPSITMLHKRKNTLLNWSYKSIWLLHVYYIVAQFIPSPFVIASCNNVYFTNDAVDKEIIFLNFFALDMLTKGQVICTLAYYQSTHPSQETYWSATRYKK